MGTRPSTRRNQQTLQAKNIDSLRFDWIASLFAEWAVCLVPHPLKQLLANIYCFISSLCLRLLMAVAFLKFGFARSFAVLLVGHK